MDQIELRHLRYFLAVAEELHFGRAASRLHIAQPPLSQQIRRLEEIVGCALFSRSSRSVKLTPAGQLLLERARRTLQNIGQDLDAVRSVARGEVGSLTVGFVGSAMLTQLPAVLRRYRAAFPRVQLRLHELHTSLLVEAIRDGSIDAGVVRDTDDEPGLLVEPLHTEAFVVVVPKVHPLARRTSIPMRMLRDEPFVFFPRTAGVHAWEKTMALCEREGFRANVVQEAPQWLTVLRLVGAGLGVTVAPRCVRRISAPDVAVRKIAGAGGLTSLDLIYRAGPIDPIVNGFRVLARSMYRASVEIAVSKA